MCHVVSRDPIDAWHSFGSEENMETEWSWDRAAEFESFHQIRAEHVHLAKECTQVKAAS